MEIGRNVNLKDVVLFLSVDIPVLYRNIINILSKYHEIQMASKEIVRGVLASDNIGLILANLSM